MGSMTNNTVHQIDPNTGEYTWETPAPGTPFGITSVGDELHVLWISAGTITGCGDPLLDRLEILDDAHQLDLTDRQKL